MKNCMEKTSGVCIDLGLPGENINSIRKSRLDFEKR